MSNDKEIMVSKTQALANETGFSRAQIELMKDTIAKGATDTELAFFLQVAQRSGLDPFARQIYMIKRNSKKKEGDDWKTESTMTIQMGIDGFRAQAQATGEYSGSDDPEFGPMVEAEYSDYNKAKKSYKHPEWAKVSVWGKGDDRPTASTVYWDEFYPGDAQGGQWRKMPRQMLAKVAEAQSLRKRFPKTLSNIYATEEMQQADQDPKTVAEVEQKSERVIVNEHGEAFATDNQIKIMYIRAKEKGYGEDDVNRIIRAKYNLESSTELTRHQIEECIRGFDSAPAKGEKTAPQSDNPEVQDELDALEGEVVAKKVPVQKTSKTTPEQKDKDMQEIAEFMESRKESGVEE